MNRAEWSKMFCYCMWPDCNKNSFSGTGLETHEIVGGNARGKALLEPGAWLRLCREHHESLPSKPNAEILARLLAIKRYNDREHYDRLAVCRLARPNHPNPERYITDGEVKEAFKAIYGADTDVCGHVCDAVETDGARNAV